MFGSFSPFDSHRIDRMLNMNRRLEISSSRKNHHPRFLSRAKEAAILPEDFHRYWSVFAVDRIEPLVPFGIHLTVERETLPMTYTSLNHSYAWIIGYSKKNRSFDSKDDDWMHSAILFSSCQWPCRRCVRVCACFTLYHRVFAHLAALVSVKASKRRIIESVIINLSAENNAVLRGSAGQKARDLPNMVRRNTSFVYWIDFLSYFKGWV